MSSSCVMESTNLGRCVSLSDREYPLFSPSIEWQSPWISFTDDRPSKLEDRKERSCSQDFEFSLFSAGSGMISADEIFCNGKMLPYNLQVKPHERVSQVGESMQDPLALVRRQNSMPARVTTASPRSSSTTAATSSITCSSRWKEMFNRFRRNLKKDYESDLSHGSETSFQSGRGNDFHCSSKRSLLRSSSMSCEYEQGGDFAMERLIAMESRSSSAANSGPLNEVAGKKLSNIELKAASMKDYLDEQSSRKKRAGHSHCGKPTTKTIPDGKGGRDCAPRRNSSLERGISSNTSRVYPGISRRHGSSDGSDILTQSGKRKESLRHLRYGKDGWVFCESQAGAYTSNVKVTPVLNMPVCMGDSLVSSRVSKFSFFDLPRKKKMPK